MGHLLLDADRGFSSSRIKIPTIFQELTFIYDTLRRGGPYALGGGLLVVIVGLLFGNFAMILAGAIVAFVGLFDIAVFWIAGKHDPKWPQKNSVC